MLLDVGGGFFVRELALALLLCGRKEEAGLDGRAGEVGGRGGGEGGFGV